jgi:hypothetical protein
MVETQIAADKIRAFRASDYQIGFSGQAIVLQPGLRSAQVAQLFALHGVNCGAFITAYNPRGAQRSTTENEQAHQQLLTHIESQGFKYLEGEGSEAGTDWPAEKSCFALGLDSSEAMKIGSSYGQDAIVWVGECAVPELVLLR